MAVLIRQLSADDWKARETAEDQIVALGSAARPPLTAALDSPQTSEEARARIRSALQRIAESEATGPTLVSLHLRNGHPRDGFAQLSRQVGYELRPSTPQMWDQAPWPRITLDLDRVPFWSAIQQLSAASGAEVNWEEDGWKIAPPGSGSVHGVARVCGPLLVVATRVNRSASIDLGDVRPAPAAARGAVPAPPGAVSPSEKSFDVQFIAESEPKLRILQADAIAHVQAAVDDRGQSLIPDSTEPEGYTTGAAGQFSFAARLDSPEHVGTRIALLRGWIELSVQTRSESIDIPLPAAGQYDKAFGDFHVTIRTLTRAEDHYELPITVLATTPPPPGQNADELWERLQAAFSSAQIKLLDARGNVLPTTGRNFSTESPTMEVTLQFARLPDSALNANANGNAALVEPARFTMELPIESKDLKVPFEFNDLPIP